MNLEARNDLADKLQHQRIDDENEQAERHQNQRNAQKQQNRPDKSVDDPEQQRGAQQATNSGVIDPHDCAATNTANAVTNHRKTKCRMAHVIGSYRFRQALFDTVRRSVQQTWKTACQPEAPR